jgi:HPr kinase/phosphorylase
MDLNKTPLKAKSMQVSLLYDRLHSKLGIKLRRLNRVDETKLKVYERDIHRPGLALAGFTSLFTYKRVQIFGNTEIRYLDSLSLAARLTAFRNISKFQLPCIIVTDNNKLDAKLLTDATERNIPVYRTTLSTTKFIYLISDLLDDQFAPHQTYHGSMLDVYGVGMLFIGRSGIGKSEIALDLVERGHRLVADDAVIITRKGESVLMASTSDVIRHFMEIRGLGLLDVQSMFGVRAIRFQKRVELVVELMDWNPNEEFTRTGFENDTVEILGVNMPLVKLPIFPGKNITVIAEVIALNYLLKHYGYDAAKELDKRINDKIASQSAKSEGQSDRRVEYFEHDFE